MTDLKIDRTVPVSREDYDAMADQRDRYRTALVRAEAYFSGCGTYIASAIGDVKELDANLRQDERDELLLDLDAALSQARDCALAGSGLVKKALKAC